MTDLEKMKSGLPYQGDAAELLALRRKARLLLDRFNNLPPGEEKTRLSLLRELLGEMGEGCRIEPPFRCDYGFHISLGGSFYANYNLTVLDCAPVIVGHHVFVGPKVGIYTARHPLDAALRREGWEDARPVIIGDDVWIGGSAVILPGVTVGSGTVIGAGSVVTRDVPGGVVAAGNPCRVLRPLEKSDRDSWVERMG